MIGEIDNIFVLFAQILILNPKNCSIFNCKYSKYMKALFAGLIFLVRFVFVIHFSNFPFRPRSFRLRFLSAVHGSSFVDVESCSTRF